MKTRITPRQRTDPALSELRDWFQEAPSPPERLETRLKPGFVHRARNILQWAIIGLLLVQLAVERQDYLRSLIPWPALAQERPAASHLKAPNEFAKQQYFILTQNLSVKKQMVKHAKEVIEMSNREIERHTFDISVTELALNKLRSEYDVSGLDD